MSPNQLRRRPTIQPRDVLSSEKYETIRSHILPLIFTAKRQRRIELGDDATLLFENRDIVLFHLHERLRAEGAIMAERRATIIAEHERLLPRPFELRASLFIDGADNRRCTQIARCMVGPWSPISLLIGGIRLRGDIIAPAPSAVHYLRFDIRTAARELANPCVPVAVGLTFPARTVHTRLQAITCRRLNRDVLDGQRSSMSLYPFSSYFAWSDIPRRNQ